MPNKYRKCERCGKRIIVRSDQPNKRFCVDCADAVRREGNQRRKAELLATPRFGKCTTCGLEFQARRYGLIPSTCYDCKPSDRRTLPPQRPCASCGVPIDIGPYQSLKRYCSDCRVKRGSAARTKKARPPAPHVVRYVTCRVCGVEFPRARLGRDPLRCPEHRFPSELTRPKRDYPREKNQRWAMVRKFGITLDERLAMLAAQGGRCFLCGERETEKVRLHVDHDHDCCPSHTHTCGRCIRGLICPTCNAALGLMNDNADAFAAMLRYLRAGGSAGSPNRKRLRNL